MSDDKAIWESCHFEGNAPKGYSSWSDFCSSSVKEGAALCSIETWNKHLAALTEKERENRELENQYVLQGAIYEGISDVLRDGDTSDFMLSFPIVREVFDLRQQIEWQTSGALCSECGWLFVIPGEGCYHCKVAALTAENADLKARIQGMLDAGRE